LPPVEVAACESAWGMGAAFHKLNKMFGGKEFLFLLLQLPPKSRNLHVNARRIHEFRFCWSNWILSFICSVRTKRWKGKLRKMCLMNKVRNMMSASDQECEYFTDLQLRRFLWYSLCLACESRLSTDPPISWHVCSWKRRHLRDGLHSRHGILCCCSDVRERKDRERDNH
jgi:hypothetical protein